MKKTGLKQKWLNVILHFSSLIYKQKSGLIYVGIIQTFLKIILIIILEIILSIISLPFYLFVVPDEDRLDFQGEIKIYRLRRKLTLAILLAFLIYQCIGTFLTTIGFGILYNYVIYGSTAF